MRLVSSMGWQRKAGTHRDGDLLCHLIKKILEICMLGGSEGDFRMMRVLAENDRMIERANV